MPPAAPSPAAGGAAVVTNYHVVRGADDLRVTLPSGAELTAKLVGQGADRGTAALELASSRTGPCAVRWSTARGRGGAAAAWRGAHGRSNGERARACEPIHAREPGRERTAQTTHTPWSARGCPPENPATEMLRLAALCFLLLLAAPLMQARSRAGAIGRAPRARAAAGTKGSFTPSRCAALGATCRWQGASAPHRGPTAAATASQPPPRGSHPQPFHPLPSPPLRPAPCFRCLTRTRAAPSRPAQSIGAAPRRAAFRTTGKCPGRGSRARRAREDAEGVCLWLQVWWV